MTRLFLFGHVFSQAKFRYYFQRHAMQLRKVSQAMPHKRIYFDTNIYAIVKKHLKDQAPDYDLIKRAIKLDFILIPGSFAVLEEALPIYRSKSPTIFALEKQTYAEIMDWQVFIKHHADLLRDEIVAYINKTHFIPFTTSYKITPDIWFSKGHAQSNQVLQTLPMIEADKKKFSGSLNNIQQTFEQGFQQLEKKEKEKMTVVWVWETLAKGLAEDVASRYGLRNLTGPQIEGLLNLRCLGTVVRYGIAYIYRKCRFSEKIIPSDSRDYHHVVLSAATDIFVTEDDRFAQLLRQMPIPNYTVWSYKQFIKWLSNGMALWQAAGLQMPDSYYSRPWHK